MSATASDSRLLADLPAAATAGADLPRIRPDLDETTLVAVYCFIKNFIGASGTSAVAIDNKIEQAMDLVKSHLMFAVREEVEVLKERISELMERITQLELENAYLRSHASQDTLAQLSAAATAPAVPAVAPSLPPAPQGGPA